MTPEEFAALADVTGRRGSVVVPVMGKSSRLSGITGIGHSPAMYFPRTGTTPGEMCAMDVGFIPRVSVPRTSSNPGEIGAVELGCRTVLGFSHVDSAQSECGAEECDYIRPAPLAGLSVSLSLILHFCIALEWFRNYLTNRSQFVSYRDTHSANCSVTCGVPQGSVWGPLIFFIYTNDLPRSLTHSNCILFADDTTIYCTKNNFTKKY